MHLLQHEQEVAITLTDVVGSFWFEALDQDAYDLILSTDLIEVEVPNVTLTAYKAVRLLIE